MVTSLHIRPRKTLLLKQILSLRIPVDLSGQQMFRERSGHHRYVSLLMTMEQVQASRWNALLSFCEKARLMRMN